jgi:uracil-DNA glycosylase
MSDERQELKALVASAKALVEWYEDTGSDGVLSDGDPFEVAALLAPRPQGRGRPQERARAAQPAPTFRPLRPPELAPIDPSAPQAPIEPPARPPGLAPLSAAMPAPLKPVAAVVDQPRLGSEERVARLKVLATTVASCTKCELHATRTQTVFARGNPDAELVFIGEGPGADEDAQGLPFVGKAGQLLDKMIAAMGLSEREIYICNIVKCRPPGNRNPEPREMAACLPYLGEQLGVIQPKVLVALGSTALRGLFGPGEGITKARGNFRLYQGTTPVMPTFHPAYVLRQPTKEIRGMVWSDLQQVLKHLGRSAPRRG